MEDCAALGVLTWARGLDRSFQLEAGGILLVSGGGDSNYFETGLQAQISALQGAAKTHVLTCACCWPLLKVSKKEATSPNIVAVKIKSDFCIGPLKNNCNAPTTKPT